MLLQGCKLSKIKSYYRCIDLNTEIVEEIAKKIWHDTLFLTLMILKVRINLQAKIIEITNGGADYSFECIGNVKVMRQRLRMLS